MNTHHPARDTTPEADAVQRAVLARMTPEKRLLLALQMSEDVREMSIDGEMARHPELSRLSAKRNVLRRILGEELFNAAYGER